MKGLSSPLKYLITEATVIKLGSTILQFIIFPKKAPFPFMYPQFAYVISFMKTSFSRKAKNVFSTKISGFAEIRSLTHNYGGAFCKNS